MNPATGSGRGIRTGGPTELALEQAARALARREVSAVELTQAALARIEAADPRYRAFITVDTEGALNQAIEADRRLATDEGTPLTGIPVAIKDNMMTEGLLTTCASRILSDFIPPYDATVVAALRKAGAVILGKTNLDEFAMGNSTENSAFFSTLNPWDRTRVPGGSSGGSAAAVTYGGSIYALGSDTGGSVRQPASFCGIVGLKPSYGRVSRWGLAAMASSLDQIGPLTKNVRDSALVLDAIAGYDPRDATSSRRSPPDYLARIEEGVSGLTLGISPGLLELDGVHSGVAQVLQSAREVYESLGASFVEVELPSVRYSVSTYYLLCPAEVSTNLARLDGIRYGVRRPAEHFWDTYRRTRGEGFGAEALRRILIGAFALSAGYYDAYYDKAARARTLIAEDFGRALEKCEALIMPVTPTPAFECGQIVDEPLKSYAADVFTVSLNLAGLPGISIPAGTIGGLPQGLQIVGRRFEEETILRVARAFERATDWSLAARLAARNGLLD